MRSRRCEAKERVSIIGGGVGEVSKASAFVGAIVEVLGWEAGEAAGEGLRWTVMSWSLGHCGEWVFWLDEDEDEDDDGDGRVAMRLCY